MAAQCYRIQLYRRNPKDLYTLKFTIILNFEQCPEHVDRMTHSVKHDQTALEETTLFCGKHLGSLR